MPTLWLFDIESHEQRYTSEWKQFLPAQIRRAMGKQKRKKWKLRVISGSKTSGSTSPGAFMNFAETNLYKSQQVEKFVKQLMNGAVEEGDRLLFADAWHPGVIQCRYMSELHGVSFSIDVMWHAGSYDKHDLLGQKPLIGRWALPFEKSVFRAATQNYFATEFHKDMFLRTVGVPKTKSAYVVGWPMEYLRNELLRHKSNTKSNVILFPHRLSKEKQPDLVKPLQKLLPNHQIVVAQSNKLSKAQYRKLVGEAVAVLSFSKQETLGIGIFEAMLCGAVPIVPDRLSYAELYPSHCYPSNWSETDKQFRRHGADIAQHIEQAILAHNRKPQILQDWTKSVSKQYFNGSALYAQVLR